MKKLVLLLFIAFSLKVYAQDSDKTVTITVTGQGKTIDEAKTNALRSAIEQAFGAFISSNTTIIDDKLVKDEIVSVTNGNIQKYEVIHETSLPNGSFVSTLKAVVSVSKLTTFCESKGIKVEFKGGIFAINMAIQELNEKSELKAWENTKKIINELIPKCFDFQIKVEEPVLLIDTKYKIPTTISITMNKNYKTLTDLLLNFSKSVSMSNEEKDFYLNHGKSVYELLIDSSVIWSAARSKLMSTELKFDNLNFLTPASFRNSVIYYEILNLPWLMASKSLNCFQINNGIDIFNLEKYCKTNPFKKLIISHKSNEGTDVLDHDFNWLIEFDRNRFKNLTLSENGNEQLFSSEKSEFYILSSSDGFFYSNAGNNFKKFDNILNRLENGSYFKSYDNQSLSCLVFHNLDNFMVVRFDDLRDIVDIKNITEYKIELKN